MHKIHVLQAVPPNPLARKLTTFKHSNCLNSGVHKPECKMYTYNQMKQNLPVKSKPCCFTDLLALKTGCLTIFEKQIFEAI